MTQSFNNAGGNFGDAFINAGKDMGNLINLTGKIFDNKAT